MSKPYVDDGAKGINLPAEQQRWTGTGFGDREQHQPEECDGNFWHCFWHHVDETPPPGVEPFMSCFECKHVYLTEGDLVDAFNAMGAQMEADAIANGWTPVEFVPVTSTELILFCPFCSHDF